MGSESSAVIWAAPSFPMPLPDPSRPPLPALLRPQPLTTRPQSGEEAGAFTTLADPTPNPESQSPSPFPWDFPLYCSPGLQTEGLRLVPGPRQARRHLALPTEPVTEQVASDTPRQSKLQTSGRRRPLETSCKSNPTQAQGSGPCSGLSACSMTLMKPL